MGALYDEVCPAPKRPCDDRVYPQARGHADRGQGSRHSPHHQPSDRNRRRRRRSRPSWSRDTGVSASRGRGGQAGGEAHQDQHAGRDSLPVPSLRASGIRNMNPPSSRRNPPIAGLTGVDPIRPSSLRAYRGGGLFFARNSVWGSDRDGGLEPEGMPQPQHPQRLISRRRRGLRGASVWQLLGTSLTWRDRLSFVARLEEAEVGAVCFVDHQGDAGRAAQPGGRGHVGAHPLVAGRYEQHRRHLRGARFPRRLSCASWPKALGPRLMDSISLEGPGHFDGISAKGNLLGGREPCEHRYFPLISRPSSRDVLFRSRQRRALLVHGEHSPRG